MNHGIDEEEQKPFYVPPVIKVIGVPGRGYQGSTLENEPSPVKVIGVKGKGE